MIVALVYGHSVPLGPAGLALVAGALALLVATRFLERRARDPLLDLSLLAIPSYRAAVIIRFLGATATSR